MPELTVAVLGTGPDGIGDGRAAGRRGSRSSSTTGRRTGRRRWPSGSAGDGADPGRGGRGGRRRHLDGRRRRRRRGRCIEGPDGAAAGAPAGQRGGRHEHGPAGHDPVGRRGRRARGAGILDAPVSGSVASTLAGELTIMVGGEAADLERAPARPRSARQTGLPRRPAGHRRGDEARGQHGHLRAQRRARRGPRPGRARPASIGRWPTTSSPRAPPAPRSSATNGRRSWTRTRRRSPSRSRSPRRTCASSTALAGRAGRTAAPGRHEPRKVSGAAGGRREDADFSMVASHLREEGRR